eukprot:gnl/MRDRNA2_/MRDRNA2_88683_c0_seq1.p1 gnl/MRDRNA2_/MRDRNA2_88683_c0~~gnl/MRDRNA2_/MRDRNA2_88683_c0_seq1.p1  ORF type:complete len:383 (+),score=57.83 gnl/MRDRNA2_/MRDRNA2_88683_c0_seq1:103-1251(+)
MMNLGTLFPLVLVVSIAWRARCEIYCVEDTNSCDESALSLLQTSVRYSRSLSDQLHDVSDRINSMVNSSLVKSLDSKEAKQIDPSVASLLEESEMASDTSSSSSPEHQHSKLQHDAAQRKLNSALSNHSRDGNVTRLHLVLSQVQELLKGCNAMLGDHQMPNAKPKCSDAMMRSIHNTLEKHFDSTGPPSNGDLMRNELKAAEAVLEDTNHKIAARVSAFANAVNEYKQFLQVRQQMAKLSAPFGKWWQQTVDRNGSEAQLALLVHRLEQLQHGVFTNASFQEDNRERAQVDLAQVQLLNHRHEDDTGEYPLISASQATTPRSGLWFCEASSLASIWKCTQSVFASLVVFVVISGVLIVASCCTAVKHPKSHYRAPKKFIYS